jgi:isopropylmalate/homocitrate/citramalate synthase
MEKGEDWLSNCVYCGVPASMVGRRQSVEIGPMSGEHNVRYYLRQHKIDEEPVYIEKILAAAKRSDVLLTEKDVLRMVAVMRQRLKAGQEISETDLGVGE